VISNTSDGQGRGGRDRNQRNRQGGKGGNESGIHDRKGGNQKDQNRPEPIRCTEDQLKTKMQVLFKKWINEQGNNEEEKKDESPFQAVRDLLVAGMLEGGEDGKDKKIRADDIFQALLEKLIDMDQQEVK